MVTKGEENLERERAILEEIIQFYMERHEAISARTLSKISRLALSPTTIRNLMEDLSEAGMLTTEGVTRGRIPTQKAYAIYVTRLGGQEPPPAPRPPEVGVLEEGHPARLHTVTRQVGRYLARQTGLVGLAALPKRERYPLDWVRFNALPDRQVLVTTKTLFDDLWSKLLVSPDPFPDDLLQEVGRFINTTYRHRSLESIRNDIMAGEPKALLADMPSLGAAFRMLRRAFEWEDEPDRHAWGVENLFRIPECQTPEQLQRIHQALADPEFLEGMLTRGRRVDGGQVVIGTETGIAGLESSALVVFPFGWRSWRGMLGVLGPMRMNYANVFSLTAQSVAALNEHLERAARRSDSLRPARA